MAEKILKFGEGLLEPTLEETKKVTLRRYRPEAHDFEEGEDFIGRFEADGMDIVMRTTAKTEVVTFGSLTDEVAREDGFVDANDAFVGMRKYYEDLTADTPCAIIRFEVPNVDGLFTARPYPAEEE